jgi:hypothetical protein
MATKDGLPNRVLCIAQRDEDLLAELLQEIVTRDEAILAELLQGIDTPSRRDLTPAVPDLQGSDDELEHGP